MLVTGAASGMGRATAHVFAQEGALVAVTDINEAGIARVVDEIKSEGGNAHGWRLDVMDHATSNAWWRKLPIASGASTS